MLFAEQAAHQPDGDRDLRGRHPVRLHGATLIGAAGPAPGRDGPGRPAPRGGPQCPGARREDRTMPLQNRVTPAGEIVADRSRGLMMGNRGCLHGQGRSLAVSRWRSKLWICCLLDFKGVQRDPMPPGRWTALFFLDEATALSAGHRPCGYCRRPDYLAFAQAWRTARQLPRRPAGSGDGRGPARRAHRPVPAQAQLPHARRRTARRRHGPARRRARPAPRRPGAARGRSAATARPSRPDRPDRSRC